MDLFNTLADYKADSLQLVEDEARGLRALIAIHSTKRGPAFGGIRTLSYTNFNAAVTDALRLAQHMSYKAALADLPAGGGKIVMIKTPNMDRTLAFIALGRAIERLGGSFFTGLDTGTTYADLEHVAQSTKFVALRLDFGKATARGLIAANKAALKVADGSESLKGRVIAVQGLGSVGAEFARMAAAAGARVILADVQEDLARKLAKELHCEHVKPAEIMTTECDAFAPCALGGILTPQAVKKFKCRVIAGSANNQLASPEVGKLLAERGITYVPDFVANAGALIKGVLEHFAGKELEFNVVDRVGATTKTVLERAKSEKKPPHEIAERIALERLA